MLPPTVMVDSDSGGPAAGATNVLAVVSLISGALAFLSSGCCCVPILSIISFLVVPLSSLTAVIAGYLGLEQAKVTGQGKEMSMAGIGLGLGGFLVAAAITALSMFTGAFAAILQEMQR